MQSVAPRRRGFIGLNNSSQRLCGTCVPRPLNQAVSLKGWLFQGLIIAFCPLGRPKSNIQTILVLPDSGRLRFPLNIWVSASGCGGEGGSEELFITFCNRGLWGATSFKFVFDVKATLDLAGLRVWKQGLTIILKGTLGKL